MGKSGREISGNDLIAYPCRYGVIWGGWGLARQCDWLPGGHREHHHDTVVQPGFD